MLIDTHAHLYSEEFKEDLPQVIERAKKLGVNKFLLPAIDSCQTKNMFELKKNYSKEMFLMAGLHPTYVQPETMEQELALVKSQLELAEIIAVGEIGIDLYWEKKYLKEQQHAFKTQIQWAKEKNLPIAIHCRESFDEIFEILEEEKSPTLSGVFHCFTGNEEQANKAISYNLKLGIGGVVTFKNGKIDQFLHNISLEHILLETDSPYLSPTPHRGKRNEPSYLTYVVEKLCSIYKKTPQEIAAITSKNAEEVFRFP